MRKTSKIAVAFILFLLVFTTIFNFFILPLPPDRAFRWDSPAPMVRRFDRNLSAYLRGDPTIPQNVILGPSYASTLDRFGGFHNLAAAGGSQSEYFAIAKRYIRPQDRIYCFVTVYDCLYPFQKPRDILFDSTLRRRSLVFREIAMLPFFGTRTNPNIKNGITRTEYEVAVLRARMAALQGQIHITNLKDLATLRPNTVFVLSPLRPVPNAYDLEELQTRFKNELLSAGFDVIDVSNSLSYNDFFDLYHPTQKGNYLLQLTLLASLRH